MATTSPSPSPQPPHLPASVSHLFIAAAVLARLAAFQWTGLPGVLEGREELCTPLSGIEHLQEGVYIWERGLNPYEGSSFHVSPLYLILFSSLSPFLSSLLWTSADLISAYALAAIWNSRLRDDVGRSTGGVGVSVGWLRKWGKDWSWNIMLLYLLNPYTILTCLSRSTTTLNNALILLSIMFATQRNTPMMLYFLSLVSFIDLYPILLLPSLILVLLESGSSRKGTTVNAIGGILLGLSSFFVTWIAVVWLALKDWTWVERTWLTILTVSDLTPNVGLWWYFFTEMFDHFRSFFIGVFQLHLVVYIAPLCIRLRNQPLLATTIVLGIISTFKSYPTLGDASLWIGMMGVFPDLWHQLRYPLLTITLHLYTIILLPLLHDLWLVSGTGNANFFYAATLVYGLGCGMGIVDLLNAGLRVEYERKVVVMMEEQEQEQEQVDGSVSGSRRESEKGVKQVQPVKEMTLEDLGLTIVQYTHI